MHRVPWLSTTTTTGNGRPSATRRRRRTRAAVGAVLCATALVAATTTRSDAQRQPAAKPPAGFASSHATPHHVVFIVLDQLRPEFIDAFHMKNVKKLMHGGTNFENAYLGHMASETVVSHNVMTTGLLPKHMGWADEWFRDTTGVLGTPDGQYVTGSMSSGQFDTLINAGGYKKLADYLHEKFPGKVVATVGQKNYAMNTMSGPHSDIRVTFGGRAFDCDGDANHEPADLTWRGPLGNVPDYISGLPDNTCNRFYVDADKAISYDTATTAPAWMYPLEGNRDIPGKDPAHLGGDVWTTDVAMQVMDHEDWSGLLLTYGGIDKAGHMWGGLNDVRPYPGHSDPITHMAAAAKTADDQVGRVVAKLKKEGILDDTLIVLTADHGQLTGDHYFGTDGFNRSNLNWYYGADSDETYKTPQPEIQRLITETGDNVRMSMQDSAIRTWLTDTTLPKMQQAADVMATLGGVRASFYLTGDHYTLRWQSPRKEWGTSAWRWYQRHGQELVDTEAAPYGPDVIGLLADTTSYGVKGDHGGAQRSVQSIPIVFSGPGVQNDERHAAIRSVDITPTILRELGITPSQPLDGRAYPLP